MTSALQREEGWAAHGSRQIGDGPPGGRWPRPGFTKFGLIDKV
jgi:hypothetical protein